MARMIFVVTAAVATLLVGSAVGAPDLQEPHRACLEASSGGHTWYYAINTDVSGTTLDRWKLNGAATYVDRNTYAAFHLPEGGRPTWDEGVAFAATMQTRNAWLNNEPTNTATWEYDADAGEDTMTWKTTVNAVEQDFVFRTNQCRDLTAPHTPIPEPPATTDVPTQPQEPDTPPPNGILHACLEASSRGVTYFYEIYSDKANDAAGTSFDRYTVAGGVDTFVDSNAFAALRAPDGDLPWHQGIQFADAMQSRAVWMNTEPTSAAEYEYDGASGEYTLTFYTTVNGGPQDYIFRTSQCRGGDVPSEPQEPDTTKAPCRKCHPTTDVPTEPQEPDTEAPCTDEPTTKAPCHNCHPTTDVPTEPQEPDTEEPCTDEPTTDVPTEPQEPDTEEPCTDEPTTEEPCTDEPTTDVPTEPQEPDTEEPCTDEPTTEEPCTDEPATDVPTEPQEPDTEEPCPPKHYKSK